MVRYYLVRVETKPHTADTNPVSVKLTAERIADEIRSALEYDSATNGITRIVVTVQE